MHMIIHFLFTKSYYIEHESGSSHCGMLLKKAVLKIKTKSLKNTGGKTQFLVRFEAYIYRKKFCKKFQPSRTFSYSEVHKGFNYEIRTAEDESTYRGS